MADATFPLAVAAALAVPVLRRRRTDAARLAARLGVRRRANEPKVVEVNKSQEEVEQVTITPEDEAMELELQAAQLRADIEILENEQAEQREKERRRLFLDFDAGSAGSLGVQELQEGMLKFQREQLEDSEAERVLKALDANGSGRLELEEFYIEHLEASLRQVREEDRIAEEEAAAAERARKEQEEIEQAIQDYLDSLPPANEDTSPATRLASVLAFALPVFDSVRLASPALLSQFPAVASMMTIMSVPVGILNSVPLAHLVLFITMQALADDVRLPKMLRFNLRQAVLMDCVLGLFGFGTVLLALAVPTQQMELIISAEFAATWLGFAYAVASTLLGETPKGLPWISNYAEGTLLPTRPEKKGEEGDKDVESQESSQA